MARLSVDVPDSILGVEKAKELASARKKIVKLEGKIRELEATASEAKRAVEAFTTLRMFLAEQFDLYEEYGY